MLSKLQKWLTFYYCITLTVGSSEFSSQRNLKLKSYFILNLPLISDGDWGCCVGSVVSWLCYTLQSLTTLPVQPPPHTAEPAIRVAFRWMLDLIGQNKSMKCYQKAWICNQIILPFCSYSIIRTGAIFCSIRVQTLILLILYKKILHYSLSCELRSTETCEKH